jgi:hypothetical protein
MVRTRITALAAAVGVAGLVAALGAAPAAGEQLLGGQPGSVPGDGAPGRRSRPRRS